MKTNWPGLVELDPTTFKRVGRLMVAQVHGEVVDLRFLGDKLASQLYSITTAHAWRSIRQECLLARRRARYREQREKLEEKKTVRRAYMKNYMQKRRARGTTSGSAG